MPTEKITSRRNPKILACAALSDKKERDARGLFAAEGVKLCGELLKESVKIETVFFTARAEEKFSRTLNALCDAAEEAFLVSDEVYEKLTEEQSPEGILSVARKPAVFSDPLNTPGKGGFLILDEVQNPQNLGTMLRTASALGISRVLLGEGCADPFGKKALRAGMGSVFKIHLCITRDLVSAVKRLKSDSHRILAAALSDDAEDIRTVAMSPADHLIIGNEGRGISEAVLACRDKSVIIPMRQNTESLNAAAAAAVLMWEKQKGGDSFS